MDESEVEKFVIPAKYKAIIEALIDNIPNMRFENNLMNIRKNDLVFNLGPKGARKIMIMMFHINNFICNEYRKRKKVLGSTKMVSDGS